jgi:hypothetical protein
VDSIGKSINGISVVEGLSTEKSVEELTANKRRAVVNVLIRLDNPNELLNRVVKVKLDLVGRRADGLITSELELLNEVLVGVLSHTSALISVKEDVVNVERSSNKRLVVSSVYTATSSSAVTSVEGTNSPKALINGADIKVDLNLVVLKSNEGKSKTRVAAIPKLEGNIEGGLRESVARSANLTRSGSLARTIDVVKRGISDEGKLGGVANHSIVTLLLINRESKVVPNVHPVTILTVNALTTNLYLNLRNKLLTREIEPTSINAILGRTLHGLVDLRESNLKVSAVSKITIARNGASYTTTEISLTVKSLLNRLHSKVSVSLVRNLPKSNLGVTGKVNVLCAISDELHKSSCHIIIIILLKKKNLKKNVNYKFFYVFKICN